MKKGPFKKTWWTVANWAYAAQYTTENISPEFPEKHHRKEALFCSAVVNVKKSNGAKTSKQKNIAEYASKDDDLIRREIQILNPDLVVCGNTWDVIKTVWKNESIEQVSERAFRIGRVYYLDLWHPGYPKIGKRDNYDKVVDLLKGIAARLPQPECKPA